MRRSILGGSVGALLLAASAAPADPLPVRQYVTDRPVLRRAPYNYAPAVIHDGALFHLYWCGGMGGDTILHLQAPALDGPWRAASFWRAADVALRPAGDGRSFDALHACDPNVIKIGDAFYLYYTGERADGALSAIGVARSADAVSFERLNGGRPIVVPARTNERFAAQHLTYGAGQPAVTRIAPYTYLSFTDSTGAGAAGNGAGQFMLRATDPSFAAGVEELTAAGWEPRPAGEHAARHSYLESFGLDLAYDEPTGLVLAVTDRVRGRATLVLLEPQSFTPVGTAELDLAWREGPGLAAVAADKATEPRPDCAVLDLHVFAAAGASDDPATWNAIATSAAAVTVRPYCSPPRAAPATPARQP